MTWPLDLALSMICVAVPAGGCPWVRAWERHTGVALDASTRWAAAAMVGIGLLQVAAMLLGFVGLLRPWTAAVAVGLVLLPAVLEARRFVRSGPGRPSPWLLAGLGLVGILLAMALVPPWYQDDMTYHLALPRTFARAGGYVVPDDNIFASLPLGWESVLSLMCALGANPDRFPPFNPRLPGAWIAGAAALGTAGLARSLGASGRAAGAAGLLLLLVPTFVHWAPSGYVEAWLVLLVALGLQGGVRAARGEGAWLVPTALVAGLAASVKNTGLLVLAFIGALVVAGAWRDRRPWREAWTPVLRYGGIALLLGCPFYVRNLVERGNPFFPSAWRWFGGEGWDAWRAWAWGEILAGYGAGRTPGDWLLLPVRLFTTRDLFDGFEGSFGPILGLGILAAAVRAWPQKGRETRSRGTSSVVAFVAAWSVAWALATQQARFWLPAAPAACALTVVATEAVTRGPGLRAVLLAVLLAGQAAWATGPVRALWQRQHTSACLAGRTSRDAVLEALLPENWPVDRDLPRYVPEGGRVWLVWMRAMTYTFPRPYRLDCIFEAWRFEGLLDQARGPADVAAGLAEGGFTHVLVNHRFFLAGNNADLEPGRTDRLRVRFEAVQEAGVLAPVASWGPVTLYAVAAR